MEDVLVRAFTHCSVQKHYSCGWVRRAVCRWQRAADAESQRHWNERMWNDVYRKCKRIIYIMLQTFTTTTSNTLIILKIFFWLIHSPFSISSLASIASCTLNSTCFCNCSVGFVTLIFFYLRSDTINLILLMDWLTGWKVLFSFILA